MEARRRGKDPASLGPLLLVPELCTMTGTVSCTCEMTRCSLSRIPLCLLVVQLCVNSGVVVVVVMKSCLCHWCLAYFAW